MRFSAPGVSFSARFCSPFARFPLASARACDVVGARFGALHTYDHSGPIASERARGANCYAPTAHALAR